MGCRTGGAARFDLKGGRGRAEVAGRGPRCRGRLRPRGLRRERVQARSQGIERSNLPESHRTFQRMRNFNPWLADREERFNGRWDPLWAAVGLGLVLIVFVVATRLFLSFPRG